MKCLQEGCLNDAKLFSNYCSIHEELIPPDSGKLGYAPHLSPDVTDSKITTEFVSKISAVEKA